MYHQEQGMFSWLRSQRKDPSDNVFFCHISYSTSWFIIKVDFHARFVKEIRGCKRIRRKKTERTWKMLDNICPTPSKVWNTKCIQFSLIYKQEVFNHLPLFVENLQKSLIDPFEWCSESLLWLKCIILRIYFFTFIVKASRTEVEVCFGKGGLLSDINFHFGKAAPTFTKHHLALFWYPWT